MSEESEELAWAEGQMKLLLQSVKSCMLATASPSGAPLSSYAPVWVGPGNEFYVYVTAMAKHYAHLKKTGKASLSLIEDELSSEELFARKRITLDCTATLIPRDSAEWGQGMGGLEGRHGSIVSYLKDLVDFDLFQLRPSQGRLVLGFGKAYQVGGDGLSEVNFLGAGGHRKKG